MNFKLQRTAAKADSTCVAMYVLSEQAALEMLERDIFPWALRIGQESPSAGSFRSLPFFARIKFLLRAFSGAEAWALGRASGAKKIFAPLHKCA